MREKLTYLFGHQTLDNPTDPTDPHVETHFLDYDANGNIMHIEQAIYNPEQPMDESHESARKFVWDEEDRLLNVDLHSENTRNQPHIAAYTTTLVASEAIAMYQCINK